MDGEFCDPSRTGYLPNCPSIFPLVKYHDAELFWQRNYANRRFNVTTDQNRKTASFGPSNVAKPRICRSAHCSHPFTGFLLSVIKRRFRSSSTFTPSVYRRCGCGPFRFITGSMRERNYRTAANKYLRKKANILAITITRHFSHLATPRNIYK